jgi:hypothetical protein
VLRDLLRSFANRREIHALIPIIELIQQSHHAIDVDVTEVETQLLGGGLQHEWVIRADDPRVELRRF